MRSQTQAENLLKSWLKQKIKIALYWTDVNFPITVYMFALPNAQFNA